jgi:hypothetical protein
MQATENQRKLWPFSKDSFESKDIIIFYRLFMMNMKIDFTVLKTNLSICPKNYKIIKIDLFTKKYGVVVFIENR